MPSQHKRNPMSLRPPEGLRDWLETRADHKGIAVNALVVDILQAARQAELDQQLSDRTATKEGLGACRG